MDANGISGDFEHGNAFVCVEMFACGGGGAFEGPAGVVSAEEVGFGDFAWG